MDHAYDPERDYRDFAFEGGDPGSTYSLAEAATILGLRSREGVRRLVRAGRLPAHQASGYNSPLRVPSWAAHGLAKHRGLRVPESSTLHPSTASSTPDRVREAVLEEAVALLLEAREHEAQAQQMQQGVASELADANRALTRALTLVIVPPVGPAPP